MSTSQFDLVAFSGLWYTLTKNELVDGIITAISLALSSRLLARCVELLITWRRRGRPATYHSRARALAIKLELLNPLRGKWLPSNVVEPGVRDTYPETGRAQRMAVTLAVLALYVLDVIVIGVSLPANRKLSRDKQRLVTWGLKQGFGNVSRVSFVTDPCFQSDAAVGVNIRSATTWSICSTVSASTSELATQAEANALFTMSVDHSNRTAVQAAMFAVGVKTNFTWTVRVRDPPNDDLYAKTLFDSEGLAKSFSENVAAASREGIDLNVTYLGVRFNEQAFTLDFSRLNESLELDGPPETAPQRRSFVTASLLNGLITGLFDFSGASSEEFSELIRPDLVKTNSGKIVQEFNRSDGEIVLGYYVGSIATALGALVTFVVTLLLTAFILLFFSGVDDGEREYIDAHARLCGDNFLAGPDQDAGLHMTTNVERDIGHVSYLVPTGSIEVAEFPHGIKVAGVVHDGEKRCSRVVSKSMDLRNAVSTELPKAVLRPERRSPAIQGRRDNISMADKTDTDKTDTDKTDTDKADTESGKREEKD